MRNHPTSISEQERDQEFFDSVTEDEIMYHWRTIRSKGMSDDDAWQAIVTGIALIWPLRKARLSADRH
jgi:hypothetical protein